MATATSTGSWLDPPELHGQRNNDGSFTLTELELKRLNDYNRKVAKMIQGGLNLANLNKATNEVFTGMVTFVDLSDPNSTTVIDGGHIATKTLSADVVSGGTLEGVTIISTNPALLDQFVLIDSGAVMLGQSAWGGTFEYDGVKVYLRSGLGTPFKIEAGGNMSIDSGGKIYIGASSGYSGNVDIGQAGGAVNLTGNVYINGVLQ